MECEELDEFKEKVGFHVMYGLIVSLYWFALSAQYTFCIELHAIWRLARTFAQYSHVFPGCVWNSGQNPVYTAADPSDAVLTLLIHAPVRRT
jgi:hypothetical protein